MIDTVALTIESDNYQYVDKQKYQTFSGSGFFKRVMNPTKEQIYKYGYLPRITELNALRTGGYVRSLRVEFSVPKLIYGNNFAEVEDADFTKVIDTLWTKLFHMGIHIKDKNKLKTSQVVTVHYSKNIVLTDYSTPYTYIKEFQSADISKIYDVSRSDFRNEGYSAKFHSNDYEVILYDKLKDLQQAKKSKKRAIENDNYGQMNFLTDTDLCKPFEVLRIEVRLGSRRKIKQVFDKESFNYTNLNFSEVYRRDISKHITLKTITDLVNSIPTIFNNDETIGEFATRLYINNPKLSDYQMLKIIGAKALHTQLGMRAFREFIEETNKNAWYRLKKQLKGLNFDNRDTDLSKIITEVEKFETVHLEKYLNQL